MGGDSPRRAGGSSASLATAHRRRSHRGWPGARKLYRGGGADPSVYASARSRHDGPICREGSVELHGALLELAMGLWLSVCHPALLHPDPSSRQARRIIACALANRANKIALAMVRDAIQQAWHPDVIVTAPSGQPLPPWPTPPQRWTLRCGSTPSGDEAIATSWGAAAPIASACTSCDLLDTGFNTDRSPLSRNRPPCGGPRLLWTTYWLDET